jgi:hypothetical protein
MVAVIFSSPPQCSALSRGFRMGVLGAFLTALSACGESSTDPDPSSDPGNCTAQTVTGTIAPGQSRSGVLGSQNCMFEVVNRPAEGWLLQVATSARLRIDVTSEAFDTVLLLTDADLQVLDADDDGGEGFNSRMVRELGPGSYYLWVVSVVPGGGGPYQISAQASSGASCEDPVGTVGVGETVTGTLSVESCIRPDGTFADPWVLTLADPTPLRIDLTSEEFDAYLLVTDDAGNVVDEDDDGGDGFNSRIVATLPAGTYTVWANTFAPGETGPYQLSVASAAGAQTAPWEGASSVKPRRPLPGNEVLFRRGRAPS